MDVTKIETTCRATLKPNTLGVKYIYLAKPKSGARIFFPARLKGTTPCPGQD